MTEERVKLTVEEADNLIVPGENVHTFVSSTNGVLIGCMGICCYCITTKSPGTQRSGGMILL